MNPIEPVAELDGNNAGGAETVVEQTPSDGSFELYLILPDLTLPVPNLSLSESIREVSLMISESPEGISLGAFGLVPVLAHQLDSPADSTEELWSPWTALEPPSPPTDPSVVDPAVWRLTKEGVAAEFTDLALIFAGDDWTRTRRGLRVVNISYTPLSLSTHILRLRDTIYTAAPATGKTAAYDPTSVAIAAGATVYSSVRGDSPVVPETASTDKSTKKGKATAAPAPAPATAPDANTLHPFTDFTLESLKPFDSFVKTQPTSTASSCVRSLAVSAWSPPPHPLRMRGHIVYLTIATLEGEIYHITGASSGFWVSKSGLNTFDPSPRSPAPPGVQATPYHSLFQLFSALSPGFAKALAALLDSSSPASLTDLYASLAITHAIPAASWLVAAPVHHADPFRTQLAYLLTTTTKAELLPSARDWNDELTQFKELPSTTLPDKLLRERLLSRVQSEFVSAATQGALAIARGDISPLNPNESDVSHTYIHNNMLYTRADDAVGGFSHVGGNAASRVAASKDLRGVGMLERLDIDGLHTMATALVDFGGKRWVVQSIIPGLLSSSAAQALEGEAAEENAVEKSAEELAAIAQDKPFPSIETVSKDDYPPKSIFRIVYGSVNPEVPDEKVRASKYFATIAEQVAEGLKLAQHTVRNAEGVSTLWTSTDCHGIAAEGRSYFLDCFRMHCVDVEFLENNTAGPLFNSASTTDDASAIPYAHRLVFLRSELIQGYYDSKLQMWIEEKVVAAREKINAEAAKAEADGTTTVATTDGASPARAPQSIIDAADFELRFNPDAFVERKPTSLDSPALVIYDPEAESTKAVRDASQWLRTVALPAFVVEIVSSLLGASLSISKLMHRKGINMRYLGMLADLVEREGANYDYGKRIEKAEIDVELKAFKGTLQHEMIARASKHILNRLLLNANSYDHASVVSHFLNCLLGTSLESHPVAVLSSLPEGLNADRTWSTLTPAALRSQIITEVASRFRYTLPTTAFEGDLRRVRMLKEVLLRGGIQLLMRAYEFGDVSKVVSNGSTVPEVKPVEVEVDASKKKKKSTGKKAKEQSAAPSQLVSFYPEDVLNLMPVVKHNTHKSIACEGTFDAGRSAFNEGDLDLGQEAVANALGMYEQIYGPVHPTLATKAHSLGIIYHQLHSAISTKVNYHDGTEQVLADMSEADREVNRPKLEKGLLQDVEGARKQAEMYLESSIRSIRQAVILSERCKGLDDPETAECYIDLALVEQMGNNATSALHLIKHAIGLYVTSYGSDHPAILRLLNQACVMIQSLTGAIEPAIPLLLETQRFAEKLYGKESTAYATAAYSLSQATGMSGDLDTALNYAIESSKLFEGLLGAEAETTVEVKKFLGAILNALQKRQAQMEAQALAIQEQKAAARLQAQAIKGTPAAARGTRNGRLAPSSVAPAEVEAARVIPTSTRGSQSVEELVSFITGAKPKTASTKSKKRRASPPSIA